MNTNEGLEARIDNCEKRINTNEQIINKLIAMKGLPRNATGLPRNKILKKKADPEENELKIFRKRCEDEGIGPLTFRILKLVRSDGIVEEIDTDEIRGNLKANLMLIKINRLNKLEGTHKLIEIEREVKERERLKAEKDAKDKEDIFKKMEEDEKTEKNEEETVQTTEIVQTTETVQTEKSKEKKESSKEVAIIPRKQRKQEMIKVKEEKQKIRQSTRAQADPAVQLRNKFFRSNIIMFQSHYSQQTTLVDKKMVDYKYLELVKEVSSMIVTISDIWIIKLSEIDYYYLISGIMEPMNSIITTISPSYFKEQAIPTHEEFYERMLKKEAENNKSKEVKDEFNDQNQ